MLNPIQIQTQNIAIVMRINTSDHLSNSKLTKYPSVVSFTSIVEMSKMITQAKICHKLQICYNNASKPTGQYHY